ncbi:uncharacterized protein LOC132785360 [Drosophila nasuta]|uniref:uncharacterized protein LOC132785360 n=1 Tax=Drosophila nasuta TaxID=42062 RepID=UPI00295F2468|nr:uncharacterized protein LOC132785360 [Drosophila nasuta]
MFWSNMFLNDIGQPLILDPNKRYGRFEQHSGPLLLTSAAFQEHVVPNDWCGQVYGTSEDIARFQSMGSTKTYKYIVLKPYEPIQIEYRKIKNILTLIPASQNTQLYYLQNDHVRVLIVDKLTGYLDFIPKAGANFHQALGSGIDVMYIDDLCFITDGNEAEQQREHLYVLIQLIRPKHLHGLRQNKLPRYMLDLCARKALYLNT